MASPRASTPESRGATPELLTPRSKIRALLATVESSDDEDDAQTSTTKKTQERREVDDDSDSDVQVRPRGKLASRMQGVTTTAKPESARDGVNNIPEREEEQVESTLDTDMAEVEDQDNDLPTAPRRLKRRVLRQPLLDTAEPTARSPSPGLFVSSPMRPSPSKARENQPESDDDNDDDDDDDDLPAIKSDRFKALVERKRQERLAREAAEESRKAERRAQQEKLASELDQLDSDDGNVSSITDDEGGRRLTQQARPTRKASKRAIEEMNRETQRMARSMQLGPEPKTRKTFTKADLFQRFNFKPAGGLPQQPEPQAKSSSRPATPQTDADAKDKDTPPSSPPLTEKPDAVQANVDNDVHMDEADGELPSLEDVLISAPQKLDKSKGKAPAIHVEEASKTAVQPKRRIRVRLPVPTTSLANGDFDDELEITTTTKDKINAVFNNIPFRKAQEPHSMQALRALAQVRSPRKDNRRKVEKKGMTAGELQVYLRKKAREQAKLERERRLEMLKARGIVIQTSEERERQMQDVEDILAKAREDAQKIMQEERAAAKEENGEADPLAWDDSEDEEYEDGANDADAEISAAELSGSEEEEGEEEGEGEGEDAEKDEEDEEERDVVAGTALFDTEADDETKETEAEDEDAEDLPLVKRKRARNYTAVLSDDEADVAIEATPKSKTPIAPALYSPAAPMSVLRSAKKTFIPGLPVQGPAGLGLTQIFAGTMDDSQKSQPSGPTQSMMPDFDHFPDSNFSAAMDEDVDDMVLDSQRDDTQTQGVQLNLAQTQMHGLDSLLRDDVNSQISQMMEPSQDCGFQAHTPLKQRFVEPPFSTVETVAVEQHEATVHDSPLVRKGRLRRRMDMSSVDDQTSIPQSGDEEETVVSSETAFAALKDGARQEKKKQLIDEFNRKKSKAKEMVEDQAEESEDEYAGLGGADGEDSDNESDASVQDIIDDAAGNDADERKLAAFYADRERENDEKQVEKLYKDITSGMLRRKRGADYDLSDSDDGGEARRRMKRRQFAKMQKALFADERVKKIAEDPGNQAFLRTIEDRGSDDEMDLLDITDAPPSQVEESQSQGDRPVQPELQTIPDSQPRKPLGSAGENRPPANQRRTKDGKKPSNIGEVRETLSDLLEDRHSSVIPATEVGSGSEDEGDATASKENKSPNPRRNRDAVVDRISLKRNATSTASNSNRLAFAATGASSSSTFKVPALLRRATTNSSLKPGPTASTSSSSAASSSGFGEEAKIKKGAGKTSGVHGFARDGERRARMQESERRRQEKKVRGAESRVGLVGGLLGKGTFE